MVGGRLKVVRVTTHTTQTTPTHLDRYLLETERVVIAVRRHPAKILEPVASATLGLLLVLGASHEISPDLPALVNVLWIGWLGLLVRAGIQLWLWHEDWFVATDTRLMLTYGVLNRRVAMMPLSKVTDMSYNVSILGRLLQYGEFVFESAGQDQALRTINFLPDSRNLFNVLSNELFGPEGVASRRRKRSSSSDD